MVLPKNELKPGRMYGLGLSYHHAGVVYVYEGRGLLKGVGTSGELVLAFEKPVTLGLPYGWFQRLELERNKPPFLRRMK